MAFLIKSLCLILPPSKSMRSRHCLIKYQQSRIWVIIAYKPITAGWTVVIQPCWQSSTPEHTGFIAMENTCRQTRKKLEAQGGMAARSVFSMFQCIYKSPPFWPARDQWFAIALFRGNGLSRFTRPRNIFWKSQISMCLIEKAPFEVLLWLGTVKL